MQMKIGKSMIGDNHPTFIIAEMSANHGHDLNKALRDISKGTLLQWDMVQQK